MRLRIFTPRKVVVDREVDSVTLPGEAGELTCLPKHDQFVVSLKEGTLYFRYGTDAEQKREDFSVSGGAAEITGTFVNVFSRAVTPIQA